MSSLSHRKFEQSTDRQNTPTNLTRREQLTLPSRVTTKEYNHVFILLSFVVSNEINQQCSNLRLHNRCRSSLRLLCRLVCEGGRALGEELCTQHCLQHSNLSIVAQTCRLVAPVSVYHLLQSRILCDAAHHICWASGLAAVML